MANLSLDRWRSSSTSPVLTRLLIGGGLVAFGLVALAQTTRFVPLNLWRMAWPLGVIAAGVLLIGYGGRSMLIAGLVLTVVGAFFLIGVAWTLAWWAIGLLWPFALIFAGVAIVTNGLRGLARPDDA
jgi:hypothetical protein